MAKVEVVGEGTVFCNSKPHLRSSHAYFPTVAELPSGELIVAFDIGSAFEAIDVRSFCCRSNDEGQSWSEPTVIFHPNESDHLSSTTCRVGQINPGELLAWGCVFDRTLSNEGLANPLTNGFCKTDFVTLRSLDGGRSWSNPKSVNLPVDWPSFETCAPPFALGGGRLLVPTTAWPTWEGNPSPWAKNGLAFGSNNLGETWDELIPVFRNGDSSVGAFEQALTKLSDGRLLSICWAHDVRQTRNLKNRIAFSTDGRAFGEPCETPLDGETCRVLGLMDDFVLAIYRRVDKPGLWSQLARIEGDKWLPQFDEPLWLGGAAYSSDVKSDSSVARMSALRFGCPAIVQLLNGDAFVVFWCVENCISVIRWFRLKVKL